MTTIKFKNGNNWENMALSCYPVGSVYMSINSTSPSAIFGGTWAALEDRMLIGASSTYTVNSTGGSATHNHTTGDFTLTTNEIPWHDHGYRSLDGGFWIRRGSLGTGAGSDVAWGPSGIASVTGYDWTGSHDAVTHHTANPSARAWIDFNASHTHDGVGGGAAHNHGNTGTASNLSPYLAVYMWKRTA